MAQELTDKQKEFVKKVTEHRKGKVEELAYMALASGLKENIPVFDLPYYVLQKAREVIGNAYNEVDYTDKKLIKARKDHARYLLTQIKEKIKMPEKVEEKDETDIRDNRCLPVVERIIDLLLDEKIIFSDDDYFTEVLKDDEKIPLMSAIAGYGDVLDDKLVMIISEHWRRSMEKLWGVEKEKVTFNMMDDILKQE